MNDEWYYIYSNDLPYVDVLDVIYFQYLCTSYKIIFWDVLSMNSGLQVYILFFFKQHKQATDILTGL